MRGGDVGWVGDGPAEHRPLPGRDRPGHWQLLRHPEGKEEPHIITLISSKNCSLFALALPDPQTRLDIRRITGGYPPFRGGFLITKQC